uniref:Uncharacterized protein n=1 Tax=Phthorimaea operculella granulovirus TaxID=192584 RepID=A0A481SCH8_9BBAC|nr:hypothetical protein PhopGVgp010 [Phthorimaea operculella granulovirus]QBH66235.1 hypothetical protein PhopGVgp010 [Phthorimaea operculella granulovirus]QBH66495.1 hypothetical protein PhopGVgp010 [Phthorimaea operculella granulovirus]
MDSFVVYVCDKKYKLRAIIDSDQTLYRATDVAKILGFPNKYVYNCRQQKKICGKIL